MQTNKPSVTIMVGIVGSGKSTHAKKLLAANPKLIRINRDALRKMALGGREWNPKAEKVILRSAQATVDIALSTGWSIIVDDTNTTTKQRKVWIDIAQLLEAPLHIIHMTETKNNLEYRMKDPRGETEDKWRMVISGMKNRFQDLTERELELTTSVERRDTP